MAFLSVVPLLAAAAAVTKRKHARNTQPGDSGATFPRPDRERWLQRFGWGGGCFFVGTVLCTIVSVPLQGTIRGRLGNVPLGDGAPGA